MELLFVGNLVWPIFKWAGGKEDLFFAKLATSKTTGQAVISVYECPDMGLLDKKSLKLDAVEYFEWSPSEPLMSIYHRESQEGNIPAKISLMKLPERKEIRQKNLFNVSSKLILRHLICWSLELGDLQSGCRLTWGHRMYVCLCFNLAHGRELGMHGCCWTRLATKAAITVQALGLALEPMFVCGRY